MIDEQWAREIATALLGRPADDPQQPWSLQEFPHGWLINETARPREEHAGVAGRVIERDTGKVMVFPSRVPPSRILADYPAVVDKGYPDTPLRRIGVSQTDTVDAATNLTAARDLTDHRDAAITRGCDR